MLPRVALFPRARKADAGRDAGSVTGRSSHMTVPLRSVLQDRPSPPAGPGCHSGAKASATDVCGTRLGSPAHATSVQGQELGPALTSACARSYPYALGMKVRNAEQVEKKGDPELAG